MSPKDKSLRVRELERQNEILRAKVFAWEGLAQSVLRFAKAHLGDF